MHQLEQDLQQQEHGQGDHARTTRAPVFDREVRERGGREGERGEREREGREREKEQFFGYVALVQCWWYVHGHLDHVPVVEDLAQVDARINSLAASAPRCSSKLLFIFYIQLPNFAFLARKLKKSVAT